MRVQGPLLLSLQEEARLRKPGFHVKLCFNDVVVHGMQTDPT